MEKQSWLPLAIAALGIVGTLLGSILVYFLNIQERRGQEFDERRRAAYVAFLQVVDKNRVANEHDADAKSLLDDANSLLADSENNQKVLERVNKLKHNAEELQNKARNLREQFEVEAGAAIRQFAVYGDKEVVEAYAKYARALDKQTKGKKAYGPCATTWQEDLAIYQAIRKSSMGPSQVVKPADLAFSALFCDPKKAAVAQQ